MSTMSLETGAGVSDQAPPELLALKQRILAQSPGVRAELEPLVNEAMEDARFRRRAMTLARDALARFRLDLAAREFDLEVTRREREALRRKG